MQAASFLGAPASRFFLQPLSLFPLRTNSFPYTSDSAAPGLMNPLSIAQVLCQAPEPFFPSVDTIASHQAHCNAPAASPTVPTSLVQLASRSGNPPHTHHPWHPAASCFPQVPPTFDLLFPHFAASSQVPCCLGLAGSFHTRGSTPDLLLCPLRLSQFPLRPYCVPFTAQSAPILPLLPFPGRLTLTSPSMSSSGTF